VTGAEGVAKEKKEKGERKSNCSTALPIRRREEGGGPNSTFRRGTGAGECGYEEEKQGNFFRAGGASGGTKKREEEKGKRGPGTARSRVPLRGMDVGRKD